MNMVLGRYATGSAVTGPDALIQDFYASECANAVRMLFAPEGSRSA